jgi:phosphatidylinositol-3-phosphatase
VLAIFAAGAWLTTTRSDVPAATIDPAPVPAFRHVYLIVLENRPFDEVIGDHAAPTLNAIAQGGAVSLDYHSVGRPSQPNYIALVSGSRQGVTDDAPHDLNAPTIADQLEAAGRSWAVSAENVPGGCFAGATFTGGVDGDGTYARKHEPFISFSGISADQARCAAHIHDLSFFDPAAADFQLIVPNLCHDAHDCPLGVADDWLATFSPRILESAAFKDRGVLFITFDEADLDTDHIPMIVTGTGVLPGTVSHDRRTHYAWLRTVQDGFGLPCLLNSCTSGNLSGLFQAP